MPNRKRNKVTYFPPATQAQFARNRTQVLGKPYEHYFSGDLWLHEKVMDAIRAPIDPAKAIAPDADGLSSLIDPGYHEVENGYCELADGSGYVASLVPFPGCSGEAFRWWFWWHSVEPARYTLWYPYNHVAANPVDREVLTAPGLTDEERYIGNTHLVDEYMGPDLMKIAIAFADPKELGLDTARFADAGIVGHACARVSLRSAHLEAATMVHLARKTDEGLELRSRYWFGYDPKLSLLGQSIALGSMASTVGLQRRMRAGKLAYEQLLHDQIEFTHLSTFLPDIYAEFGAAAV
jgi:2,4-diacetylphloroglucinol hydrolase